jgi:hypothetical protein
MNTSLFLFAIALLACGAHGATMLDKACDFSKLNDKLAVRPHQRRRVGRELARRKNAMTTTTLKPEKKQTNKKTRSATSPTPT